MQGLADPGGEFLGLMNRNGESGTAQATRVFVAYATTRYRCQRSGTPFSSCSPASSKVRPDPAVRSLTV
jgi:hypothetical protein